MVNVNFIVEVADEEDEGKWIDVAWGNTDSQLVHKLFDHMSAVEATNMENEEFVGTRITVSPGHQNGYDDLGTIDALTRYLIDNW